ncbi:MAG: ATP-binding protein [Alphaproteobacteria bacterium]|nr:ATP-binding protein [Alphaproteobacteria bacterium]
MMQRLRDFFDSDNFMPHGHCFLWQPDILWLHILSDAMIVSAYYSIPGALLYFVWKRKDLPFGIILWLFGAFILLCGTTHLMSIWVLWHPDYAIEGLFKAATGIVSIITFFVTVRLIPHALQLASPAQLAALNETLRQNISEREIAQQDLQRAYREMEKKVEERTAALNASLEQLSKSNDELDEFAHIVSHDLKEPLRGLHNNALFLLDDYKDKLDAKGAGYLDRLVHLSDRMQNLIEDLLYFSRLGHAELAIQETDPNLVVDEIGQMMESFLKEHNARIVVPRPMPHVVCDKPRITEVFRNLITNAVKYNDKPERLVEVGFLKSMDTPQGPARDVFYVRDNGIGIDPQFHEEIFGIFKRLDAASEDKGTGVGLTFVRRIITRHGGRVWVESAPGKGSTFYFVFSQKPVKP